MNQGQFVLGGQQMYGTNIEKKEKEKKTNPSCWNKMWIFKYPNFFSTFIVSRKVSWQTFFSVTLEIPFRRRPTYRFFHAKFLLTSSNPCTPNFRIIRFNRFNRSRCISPKVRGKHKLFEQGNFINFSSKKNVTSFHLFAAIQERLQRYGLHE